MKSTQLEICFMSGRGCKSPPLKKVVNVVLNLSLFLNVLQRSSRLPEPADTGRWRLGGGGRVVEQSDQRVVTPYALKQHGDALGSLIWDCFFFFFVQRYIDDCFFASWFSEL